MGVDKATEAPPLNKSAENCKTVTDYFSNKPSSEQLGLLATQLNENLKKSPKLLELINKLPAPQNTPANETA